jgi:hypothetical protein
MIWLRELRVLVLATVRHWSAMLLDPHQEVAGGFGSEVMRARQAAF